MQLIVSLPVFVVVRWFGLSAALLPHHRLFLVLPPVQTGPLVDADTTHHLPVGTDGGGGEGKLKTHNKCAKPSPLVGVSPSASSAGHPSLQGAFLLVLALHDGIVFVLQVR